MATTSLGADTGWISLFDGKSMDGWKQISPHENRWVVENGIMMNKTKGCDIAAGPNLKNMQVHVEFMLPGHSNSGIYLRGHYEIQIQSDYGKRPENGTCGGIYGQHVPRVNATRPDGEWQTFDATLIGNTISVVHNGVAVITKKELTGVTGAAMPGKHGDPGPLKIQGDHGPLQIRSVLIHPLKDGEAPVAFPAPTGFTSIFDGKTTSGWDLTACGHGTGGKWEVIDGALAGDQDKPGNGGIMLSTEQYGDFELSMDIAPDWGVCSGIFLRSNTKGQCYQIMVDYHTDGNVGGIYGEGTGGFNVRNYDFAKDSQTIVVRDKPDRGGIPLTEAQGKTLYFHDDWNHIDAKMTGNPPTIDVWLNGVHVSHYMDTEKRLPDKGHIGVQVHGGGGWPMGKKTRFKNIHIMPLK
jgi:hypothetical protein